jgi:hypothetical protein
MSFETDAFISTDATTLSPPLWTEAQLLYFEYNKEYFESGCVNE